MDKIAMLPQKQTSMGNNQANQERIRIIYQMLFEMATGNFTYRIAEDGLEDELSGLSKILNKVAKEMQIAIENSGYVSPKYTYQNLVQSTFILNRDFFIVRFNDHSARVLGYLPQALVKIHFSEIVSEQSSALLTRIQKSALENVDYNDTVHLIFRTSTGKFIPSFCTVSKLVYSEEIIICMITTVLEDFIFHKNPAVSTVRNEDARIIQKLHHYILEHLDSPLPTLKELSILFGSNEFKLKNGFRHFFQTSIYHFYHEERLKKAHLLIQQTDHPVKTIAIMSGFNDYINFYKAFKKRFGYSPSELHRDFHDTEGE